MVRVSFSTVKHVRFEKSSDFGSFSDFFDQGTEPVRKQGLNTVFSIKTQIYNRRVQDFGASTRPLSQRVHDKCRCVWTFFLFPGEVGPVLFAYTFFGAFSVPFYHRRVQDFGQKIGRNAINSVRLLFNRRKGHDFGPEFGPVQVELAKSTREAGHTTQLDPSGGTKK